MTEITTDLGNEYSPIEPSIMKAGGVISVWWPPYDPDADSTIRLRDLVDFVMANELAFDRFRHARYGN